MLYTPICCLDVHVAGTGTVTVLQLVGRNSKMLSRLLATFDALSSYFCIGNEQLTATAAVAAAAGAVA